ncbi:hypothetical protein SERLA73DRAFT_175443 [Serpula lacrymans var. lacrymans S7.3]|uniref:glutathione transferase n=2 Tax=Serpula lacrymans var. lacrymans TaxID=341189 RepID=F8PJX2_SERL3|nr:uncharacterized protein SERLADRAFT_457713 [Serpula lacrymans var. lacrymans S7.9]EGO03794.1 hypothetical protein SERLA73DRAFT_175443 [Serpula lacrymans var. lacrymans S7.3]EGO29656.1 hypothetical protein SERLADRAFT_457713 [Serpula lacrymans var. lacrymans S7.9]
MTLKLYGMALSTNTQRVTVVCHEKNIPFELVKVDLFANEHKSAGFLEKQPFGQVPYIDDDGFVLYESRPIAAYIARKYAAQGTPGLVPSDPQDHALYEQAVATEMSHFDPSASGLSFEMIAKKIFFKTDPDEARVAQLLSTLNAKLDVYEEILGKQKYLAGDEITLADLFHLPAGTRLVKIGLDVIEKRPNVSRWWKDISSRPSWVAVTSSA